MSNKKNHNDNKGKDDVEFGRDDDTIVRRFPRSNYIDMKAYDEIYAVLEEGGLEGVEGTLHT